MSKFEKKLSIIVPVYNCEKYLHRCIDSILYAMNDQTELIIVDDGSTDGSSEICDEYMERAAPNMCIQVIHQSNGGAGQARAKGVEMAKGEYIAFVDGDDYIDLRFIATAVKDIEYNSSDVIFYRYVEIPEKNTEYVSEEKTNVTRDILIQNVFLMNTSLARAYAPRTLWAKLFRRSLFVGQSNLVGLRVEVGEDMLLALYLYSRAETFYFHNTEVYHYFFKLPSSTTNRYKPEMVEIICNQQISFQQWLKQKNNSKYSSLHAFYRLNDIILLIKFDLFHIRNKETSQQRRKRFRHMLKKIHYAEYYAQAKKSNTICNASFARRVLFWLAAHQSYTPIALLAKLRYGAE